MVEREPLNQSAFFVLATDFPMSDSATTRNAPLQIRWRDADGQVTLEPENQDRFTLRFRQIIEACQIQQKAEDYKVKFDILVRQLGTWLDERDDVDSAFLTLRDAQFLFIVVTKFASYDAMFEDDLSDLDVSLANDPDLSDVPFGVLSLPNVPFSSLASFMHPTINFELTRDRTED